MIYAINKRTKEHRASPAMSELGLARDWEIVEADADGWIPWEGGECPLPDGMSCEVKHRDGEVLSRDKVEKGYELAWMRMNLQSDIIAYRPILDAKPGEPEALRPAEEVVPVVQCRCASSPKVEPEASEWDGEGAPPVGATCLMQSPILGMWANEWLEVEVIARRGCLAIGWCKEKEIAIWSGMLACRPIRTAAQRAEEEVVGHMKSVAGMSYVKPEFMEMICRALYRAGYRKEA